MRYMQALTQAVVTVATAGLALLSSYATSAPMDFDGSGMSDIFFSYSSGDRERISLEKNRNQRVNAFTCGDCGYTWREG